MADDGRTARKMRWWVLIAGCCLGLVLAELLAGVVMRSRESRNSPTWGYATFFPVFHDAADPAGLYVAHPYWAYDMKADYREITNDLGFRGPAMDIRKRAGTLRVVCLGGSTTYCIRNDWEFSYPKLLGDELVARLGPRVEVINAGLVSATTAESAHRLIGKILPLDPDLVIIYHAVNDLAPRVLDDPAADYSGFRRVPLDRKSL